MGRKFGAACGQALMVITAPELTEWRELDWDAVVEEIEGSAGRHKRELASRLDLLVIHLLRWRAQA